MMSLSLVAAVVLSQSSVSSKPMESERHMVFEAKLGPYVPLIDRPFAAQQGPYYRVYNSEAMILGEGSLEYQVFQTFGSIAVGASAGYAEKYAPSIGPTGEKLAQKTGLKVIPLKAYAVYRFDWLASRFGIPLVPYGKLGLAMAYWSVSNGDSTEIANGMRGAGSKYGYFGVGGLALMLDFLDPRLARDFDSGMGVNHSYVFAEYAAQELNNFGTQAKTDLDFSSRHWMFGLAFEF